MGTDMNFVYVFSSEDRDKLCALGFSILKEDPVQDIYVFENRCTQTFASSDMQYVLSDKLTF